MENTVVFNWPSGAGGDFIISCANILDGKTVNFIETTNQWSYSPDSYTPEKYARRMNQSNNIIDWNNMSNYKVFCMHDLPLEIENRPGLNLPKDLIIVNIDSSEQQPYIFLLYLMKSEAGHRKDIKIHVDETPSWFIEYFKSRQNFFNFKYYDLFFKQDREKIKEVVSLVATKPVTKESDVDDLVKLFGLYNNLNQKILRSHTYKSIGKPLGFKTLLNTGPIYHCKDIKNAISKLQSMLCRPFL